MGTRLSNFRERWNEAKLSKSAVFWIAVAVVFLTIYLGFSWGGWITTSKANRMADIQSRDALVERLAPICVAQFDLDPQRVEKLGEFQLLSTSSQRTRYVQEQTWAVMPGDLEADDKIAAACAKQILSINGTSP